MKSSNGFIREKILEPDEYVNSYVAYLDMLGFKELCSSKKLSCAEIKAVFNENELLNIKYNEQFSHLVVSENTILNSTFTIMSDSIVISAPGNDDGLLFVLYQSSFIQNLLLKHKILLRGGIAKGDFFKCKNIMFGPAMIEAYGIESSIAIYPRVVLAENVINDIKQRGALAKKCVQDYIKKYIKTDESICSANQNDIFTKIEFLIKQDAEDSQYYVHFFNSLEMLKLKHNNELKRTIDSVIEKGLIHENERVRLKYQWLNEYYQDCLHSFPLVMPRFSPDGIQNIADAKEKESNNTNA